MGQVVRTFISPEEVFPNRIVTYEELGRLAASLNRDEALHFLGFLNLLVSSATIEAHLTNNLEPVRDVQTWLIREVISKELLATLQAKFGPTSLLDRPMLHRHQLLFVTRLVATWATTHGGNRLTNRDDFDVIGDLLFLTNGLLRVPPAASKASTAVWLAAQMGPMYETENPPDIEFSWPRLHDLLTRRLPKSAADPAELEQLERVTLFGSGFNFEEWLDLSFMLFSFWSSVDFKTLMTDRSRGYLNPAQPHELASSEVLTRAFQGGLSTGFADLPRTLRIETFSRGIVFDVTPFRASPVWIMPDGTALCVDVALLLERLGAHAFWTVMNALDTPERRRQFTSTWGNAFESYCLDALQTVFRAKKWLYFRNPRDKRTHQELWDAVAVRGDTAIVIECKGTFIRSADKYSGEPGRFFRGLSQKFGYGKHAGVYQLNRGISAIWFNETGRSPIQGLKNVDHVFPVLVAQDPILGCGPVIRVLSDRFEKAVHRSRRGLRQPKVWPLTVITPDALDRLSAVVAATGERLDSILKSFHRSHPSRMIPLGDFMSSDSARFNSEAVRVRIKDRFHSVADASLARFRDAAYGGIARNS